LSTVQLVEALYLLLDVVLLVKVGKDLQVLKTFHESKNVPLLEEVSRTLNVTILLTLDRFLVCYFGCMSKWPLSFYVVHVQQNLKVEGGVEIRVLNPWTERYPVKKLV
jgi:hypothetical protein